MKNHPRMKYTYIGVDSHKDTNTSVVINCFYEKLGEVTFDNVPSAFDKFLETVHKLKVKGTQLAFGLEDVSQYGKRLKDFLVKKKLLVKHVNAGLVASERKNISAMDKTDSIDALSAARVLINRFNELPDARIQDKYGVLESLVSRRNNVVRLNSNLKNHLHSHLTVTYPSYTKFFEHIDSKSALMFFDKFPCSDLVTGTTVAELEEFLYRYAPVMDCKEKAQHILTVVEKSGSNTLEYQETRNSIVRSAIRQISENLLEIERLDSMILKFMDNFEYNLDSLTGVDVVLSASLVAEIGDIAYFSTPAKLAKYAGISPVTYASGKSDVSFANSRGNRTLNSIFYKIALHCITLSGTTNKRILNPIMYEYYQKKLSEGKTKRMALKCVQRRLVNIVWSMMTNKTSYIAPLPEKYVEPVKENSVADASKQGKKDIKKEKSKNLVTN